MILMQVIEQYLCGKAVDKQCEDMIFIGNDYIAVIDGVTGKSGKKYSGKSQGYLGASIVYNAISKLDKDESSTSAVAKITSEIETVYRQNKIYADMCKKPVDRFSSTAAIYSKYANEVWFIGSCQGYVNGRHIFNKSKIDTVLAESRALFIETEIASGTSLEEIQARDVGRGFIYPALARQSVFENSNNDFYGYSVFNGITVPEPVVCSVDVFQCKEIVLATDGYPTIQPNLTDSEELLEYTLKTDPLRIKQFKSTKGLEIGNVSFDDRAYVRFKL